jgi:phage-related protein
VRFEQAVFVLHCFQKKSKTGIATPQREIEIIKRRIKVAEEFAKELAREGSRNSGD